MRKAPILGLMLGVAMSPAVAQQSPVGLDGRVGKLEKEMRAVQRKVFPGGSTTYFEPEITPQQPAAPGGIPATSPVADLTSRVNSLEQSLGQLTGQVEQNGFKIRQLEEQIAKLKGDAEFRLNKLEGGAPPPPGPAGIPVAPLPPVQAPAAAAAFDPPPAAATGDPAEDGYMAGYRLWEAKRYPAAAAALKDVVAKYPKSRRASYAQNLMGRAYLDDGKPAMAAEAFYANYQKMPRGERAPDSLYYLGLALIQLKKPAEACKVYDEMQDVYGATLTTALKPKVADARKQAKCS